MQHPNRRRGEGGGCGVGQRRVLQRHGIANPYPEAPEIVIEILSPSNTLAEMEEKKNCISRAAPGNSGFARKMAGCGSTTTMPNWRPAN